MTTENFKVTSGRIFSKVEQQMIWCKPASHQTSQTELQVASEIKANWDDPEMKISNILLEGDAGSGKTQLAKALSADLQLPYTKVTCFADMDKSDVFGALLPVINDDEEDEELLAAIYQTDSLDQVLNLISRHYSIGHDQAREKLAQFVERLEQKNEPVHYKFYPSEIVRALEKGYLLEIQEPTVIRDASVLVALNSALENSGTLNLPTGIIRRHPDCVVVITTNRNYQGNRPLNESLRDRVQHAEKMDLPTLEVMTERAAAKTGFTDPEYLLVMAKIIRLLDETAKANAIKGVAGMRSYFYWVNTLKQAQDPLVSLAPKVLYKLTTDETELEILQRALDESGLLDTLSQLKGTQQLKAFKAGRTLSQAEADARNITEVAEQGTLEPAPAEVKEELSAEDKVEEAAKNSVEPENAAADEALEMEADQRSQSDGASQNATLDDREKIGSNLSLEEINALEQTKRKELNQEVRKILKGTAHQKEGTLIHRPKVTQKGIKEAAQLVQQVTPEVEQLLRQMAALFEQEERSAYAKGKYYGTRFDASRVAYGDLRTFDQKNPPDEQPSLALAVRVDESGSMIRDERIENAKKAALALSLFAEKLNIPFMLYGDSADVSQREKTSLYSYKEFTDSYDFLPAKITTMKPRQNNRDGAVLRVMAAKLNQQVATTKILLNLSDGQPKALPDYTGPKAQADIQQVLQEYERQGVIFIACAIGEDKQQIKTLYGEDHFVDISEINTLTSQLLHLIQRFI